MRRVKKVWLRGFASGVAMTFVLGSGMYYIENGKLPFTGDSLGTGASGRKLQAIEKLIDEEYLGEIDKAVMEDYMYYGVVSSLGDRYSQYVTAEQYADLTQSSNGVYVGVGVVMQQDPETKIISVVQCYENSPAEKAGVLVGDVLYKVNDYVASEYMLSDLLELSIWEKGTVTLYIQREGYEEPLALEVEIGEVEVPSVYSRMLKDNMGYIQISQFTEVTPSQFKNAYHGLLAAQMKGLIVDLRENPGGLLSSVCQTAEHILPEGLIVYIEDKHGEKTEYTCKGETPIEIPLVILVNENSASAAEVFSGAVKDHGIAMLVGNTTFGKGIVQKYFPFKDGSALKVTIANYYTLNGTNIHGTGITPDVVVEWNGEEDFTEPSDYYQLEQSEWEAQDNQFEKAIELLSDFIKVYS